MSRPEIVIIGGGVAAIALAHTLKCKLGFDNFVIYEKRSGLGGTWRANTYPGCGSDVPIHLYSFSFNLNPEWTQALADQEEILRYIEATVDKFNLRSHFVFNTECKGAEWKDDHWELQLSNTREQSPSYTKRCEIFVPAVGGFSQPRWPKFPGMESFKGKIFHTADWDHSFDWRGKRVAVIGNGCSAAQVVPSIAPGVERLTQYARSAQWYHPRPNKIFTSWDKFCFRYIPLYQRWHRLDLFLKTDQLASVYGSDDDQVRKRLATEEEARKYIYREAPEKYHDFIVPDFPLGCKRRIYDPGYLASLHRDNVELLPEGIQKVTEEGIVGEKGVLKEVDAIILASGFQVTSFLTPMRIVTKSGKTLQDQWDAHRGAQAYMGTFVHNCPNLGILFGPNTFPAFNSVIYAIEVQVDYLANVLLKPIIDGRAKVLEVKEEAEEKFVLDLDRTLDETVFAAGCSNWYINSAGRNSAAWPGLASTFWKAAWWPKRSDFDHFGGSVTWPAHSFVRTILASGTLTCLATAGAAFQFYRMSTSASLDTSSVNHLKDLIVYLGGSLRL